jgi:hypothetical protein
MTGTEQEAGGVDRPLQDELTAIDAAYDGHIEAGKALFEACSAHFLPMDVLALAVLDRSLSTAKGFCVLMRNGGYLPAAGLLRMQLDSVVRFYGVMRQPDPHDLANRMVNGDRLARIKDANGDRLHDAALRALLKQAVPWVDHVYSIASGYVHLSEQHARHLAQRCALGPDGKRQIAIGDADEYLRDDQRHDLAHAFAVVTRGVPTTVRLWIDVRDTFGDQRGRFLEPL